MSGGSDPLTFGRAVAHDLQQPLFALGGLLELLADSAQLADGDRELLCRARRAHEQLDAAVDDLRAGRTARLPTVARLGATPG